MLHEQRKYYETCLQEMDDKEFCEGIRENLQEHIELYEEAMAEIVDPAKASPKTVFNYFVSCWRLWTMDKMQPMHYLIALDSLEIWYMVQGVEYPYAKRLNEQREYWKKRSEETNES